MISDSTRTGNHMSHKRWLPGRAWDFESLMYPSVFSLKLFGYFPYKYQNDKYEISTIRLALTVFAACFHSALQIYVLYTVNFSDPISTITQTMAENFFALLDASVPMLMILSSYSRSLIFQRISKVSRILSPQDFNDMAKFLHLVYILHYGWHLLYLPIYYANKQHLPFVRRNVNLFIGAASFEGILYNFNCVYVLGACYKKINESLQRLREPSTNRRSEVTEEHEPRRQGVMLLKKVKYYEDVLEEISDAVDQFNKSSRWININFTIATFVLVTFDLYMFILQTFYKPGLSTNIYMQYEYFSYVCLRFLRFALLIWACETAAGQATEINTTIYDLANKCTDYTVKRELRYFALQAVHGDNAITTKVFKMNGKLLSQVLNGILMYIMILIQFLMNSNCSY